MPLAGCRERVLNCDRVRALYVRSRGALEWDRGRDVDSVTARAKGPKRPLSMRECPEWLHEIDHTADTGIEVSGRTREELFERAAYGMFWLIASVESVEPSLVRDIELEAGDQESMLVKWLSELNYLHQVEHLVFSRFEIDELGGGRLKGRAYGDNTGGDGQSVFGEIKAVTYHGLRIVEHDGRWSATIIFDL